MILKVKSIDDHEWIPNSEQIKGIIEYMIPNCKFDKAEIAKLDKALTKSRETKVHTLIDYTITHKMRCKVDEKDVDVKISVVKNNSDRIKDCVSIFSIEAVDIKPTGYKSFVSFVDETSFKFE